MTHDYNTYKEIFQQPKVWLKTLDYIRANKDEIQAFTDKYLQEGYEIVLTGAGTSAYIGDALVPALYTTDFKGAKAIATTDIITSPEMYFDRSSKVLLVSFARSGNSPESVGAIKTLEKTARQVAHIFITCNKDGHLARTQGDNILCLLLPPETNDLSLAMTSSYSTMLLTCSMVANIDRIEEDAPLIQEVASCVEKAMSKYENALQELASRDYSVLVYLVSPNPAVRRYELDLIRQVNANNHVKGVLVACFQKPELEEGDFDLCIETGISPSMPACYGCVSFVFVGQLLGLFKSIDKGLSPDSPSVSGNISRVVEGVTLYID